MGLFPHFFIVSQIYFFTLLNIFAILLLIGTRISPFSPLLPNAVQSFFSPGLHQYHPGTHSSHHDMPTDINPVSFSPNPRKCIQVLEVISFITIIMYVWSISNLFFFQNINSQNAFPRSPPSSSTRISFYKINFNI